MRNSRKVFKAIKRFDLFEKPVQLLIKRDEGHKTVFGAILTITLVVIMLIQMISQLKTLNDKSNPQSFFTEVYHHAPDYQKWSPNNFTIGFSLQDPTYATYIDESIYTVKAILQVKSTQVQNGVSTTIFESVPVNLTTCNPSVLKQAELFDYFTQNLDMPTNYCIDWNSVDYLYIQGNWDSDTFVSLQLLFSTCTQENRRPGGPECKSDEEIKKKLQGNYFTIAFSTYTLDLTNPYKPFEPIGQDYYTSTSNQITKEISFYMMPVTVNTDHGLITEDIESLKTIRFDRNTELMDLSAGVQFLKVVFRMETTEQVYNRSYQKITLIFSNLGGLWQVLFSIALMIQKPISELSYKIQIINSLFNFEGSQEKEFQQSRSKFYKERSEFNLEIAQKSNPTSPRELLDQADDNINHKDYSHPDNNSRYEKSRKQAKQRLKSIVAKQNRMQEMESDGDLKKIKTLTKDITLSLKKYFKLVKKKLELNLFEYVYFLRCLVKKDENKAHQIDFASDKMDKSIDILYLIKKIQEIDKLKTILLTKDQIKLFDYLPKPTIPINPAKLNQDNQYFSILRPVKTDYQRANEAKNAFQEIMKDPFNPINKNLISCMDENIINLLCINLDEQQKVSPKIDESSLRDEREDELVQVNEIYISKP